VIISGPSGYVASDSQRLADQARIAENRGSQTVAIEHQRQLADIDEWNVYRGWRVEGGLPRRDGVAVGVDLQRNLIARGRIVAYC
jgi:hypothetical protein